MKVSQIMTREVVTLGADDPLITAEELMGLRRFRHLPVVEPGDKLVGLVTHKDMLRATASTLSHPERLAAKARTRVREIMRTRVATVTPDTDLAYAAGEMAMHKYGCMPVIEGETLVGILTEADFLLMVKALLEGADDALLDAVSAKLG